MDSARRVLHVIPSVAPARGGPSAAVRTMAEGLVAAGVDVHVATTDDAGAGRLDVPLGVPVDRRGVVYWYFARQARVYTLSLPLSRWLSRRVGEYDLVHVHALFSHASTAAAGWAWRRGVPYIIRPLGTLDRWSMRRGLLKRLSFRLVERHAIARAALVHCTSAQERVEAAALGVTRPMAVVPLGLDPGVSAALPARGRPVGRRSGESDRTIVLSVSRLDPKKGLDLLLDALAHLRGEPRRITLVVVGAGAPAFEGTLRRRAEQRGVAGDVVWAGYLDGPDKQAALAGADMFVLPSYSENFGLAVVEAMACGLPVVISDRVGIHPDVAAADAGHVVPCDAAALAQAIRRLARDPAMRARMGEAGRRLVKERFSVEAMTAGLLRMYGQALGQAGPRVGRALR